MARLRAASTSTNSGARDITPALPRTAADGSCAAAWNGRANLPDIHPHHHHAMRPRTRPAGGAPPRALALPQRPGRGGAARALKLRFLLPAAFVFAWAAPAAHAADAAYVRVNQVGYEAGSPARAYLMSTADESGATFTVGGVTGPVGAQVGTWSNSATLSYRVYPLDFTLSAGSGYTISVHGPAPAASPRFDVAAPAGLYEKLLGNSIFYYRSVRDGRDFVPGPLSPAPAHLDDARATTYLNPPIDDDDNIATTGTPLTPFGTTIDASGGHWDAGDNMKYVETESYTDALMAIGVRDFPDQMGPNASGVMARNGATVPDFSDETKFGMDFLLRMYDDVRRVLYFQVGNTQEWANFPDLRADYDFWRLPQVDDTAPDHPADDPDGDYSFIRHRPVFVANAPGQPITPNLAGRLAADFALYYQLYRTTDPLRAALALKSAKDVFAQADLSYADPASDDRPLLTIIPFDGYPESVWDDDMELGATELYFATHDASYLKSASHFASRYNALAAGDKDTLNLYDVGGLANYELYRALGMAGDPGGLETTRGALVNALKASVDGAVGNAGKDAFNFGRNWRAGDTTSHGDGLAVMADEVDNLRGDKSYDGWARGSLGNMMGANPWGVSLIIGDGSTWTQCPQQQPANLLGSLTGGSPELWGAAVEGPTSSAAEGGYDTMKPCPPGGGDAYAIFNGNNGAYARRQTAVYRDNVESYTTTEPAIDLTASSLLMFSWRQNGHPDNWTTTDLGASLKRGVFSVTATVASTGPAAPTGRVTFAVGPKVLGTAPLVPGADSTSKATLQVHPSLSSLLITASYGGTRGVDGPSTSLPLVLAALH